MPRKGNPNMPPGKGRPPGTKNRATIRREMLAEKGLRKALEQGVTPLEVILRRMRAPSTVSPSSFEAAVAAAPYVHPKLSAVAYKRLDAPGVIDLRGATDEELAVIDRLVARGPARAALEAPGAGVIEGEPVVATEADDDGA